MGRQLTLKVQLSDEATFANFFSAKNQELVSHLQSTDPLIQQVFYYLWGASGVGKSHLLQASCLAVLERGLSATYLSLDEEYLQPEVLDGLEDFSLVCLDELQAIIGNRDWEESLFHLYNRMRDASTRLIVAADVSPKNLACVLPDLQSRLSWGISYQVYGLSDQEKLLALQIRAKQRGLTLSDEVGNFLLNRCARDMSSLYKILEHLDSASLSAKRPLTVPFVKDVLQI